MESCDGWCRLWSAEEDPLVCQSLADERLICSGHTMVPLRALRRICGPEPGCHWPEVAELFADRVARLRQALDQGWVCPPLLVLWELGAESALAHVLVPGPKASAGLHEAQDQSSVWLAKP